MKRSEWSEQSGTERAKYSMSYSCFAYYNLLKRGVRISLRSKVNDCLISGLRIIDSILAVGRGQRQLILGDRYTGKTSIYLSLVRKLSIINALGSIDGFGTRRIFGVYTGINQNLSKLSKLIYLFGVINWFSLILATHSSSSALLSFMLPLIAVSISERLRDRGYDICICFDDLSKHSKAYRQCSLLLNKIPSRDAYPADIFNIHSSLLERCGKLKFNYFGGSITSLPIIETINADITEYIATNVISITDGQFYTNRSLFLNSNRPAIDSGLSVSRIGSNAQCKLMKIVSLGIKNELTNYRLEDLASESLDFLKLCSLNLIFYQDYLLISSLEISMVLLLAYRNGVLFNSTLIIHRFTFLFSLDYLYVIYLIFISKCNYTFNFYSLITFTLTTLTIIFNNHISIVP
jgi:proton translocating ATP synthase F1 alpha subunit